MRIESQKDPKTGIYRLEVGTVNVDACRAEIERCGKVKQKDGVADTISYLVSFKDSDIYITTTPTRVIAFGEKQYAMLEYLDRIKGDEREGTSWAYDDTKRSDYQIKK